MQLPVYQVASFAEHAFSGNPAAVCPLEAWLPDELLQAIATENNLSETAYFVHPTDRSEPSVQTPTKLRWFTPSCEVELCGHATLAAGWVLFERLGVDGDSVEFDSLSGPLAVTRGTSERGSSLYTLDFPGLPPRACEQNAPREDLGRALGRVPEHVLASETKLVCVYGSAAEVRALEPDFARCAELERPGIIATAPADEAAEEDFVSRFFAPALGVPEDPVTGSAHAVLAPYWGERLGRDALVARQVSARGGRLVCELRGERVRIAGAVQPFLEGTITVGA